MEREISNEKLANFFLDSFFCVEYNNYKLLFDNMQNIYAFISYFYRHMEYIDIETLDIGKSSKSDIYMAEKLIDNFYKSIGVNFKVNDVIRNGTFNIIKTNTADNALDYGNNNYMTINSKIHKAINVYNNGLVSDTIIWVHELSHYRNQPLEKRGEVNDILTELLAFTEEFIYMDYLEKNGYADTVISCKITEYNSLFSNILISYYVVRIYLLYYLLGDVSKDNYICLYGDDRNYEESLEIFLEEISKNKSVIFRMLYYSVGLMSLYNYMEYKKDNKFIDKIEMLNESLLNDNISLEDALKTIDIKLDNESLNRILENINIFKEKVIKKGNTLNLKR